MIVTFDGPLTVHGPVPLQLPPLQPANTEPGAAVAANLTGVPLAKTAEQLVPQLIPGRLLVTIPLPAPAPTTVTVNGIQNAAVTTTFPVALATQFPTPLQAPLLQPPKTDPEAAVAVSVTVVPLATLTEHAEGQSMPGGLIVTVPLPRPDSSTVTVAGPA